MRAELVGAEDRARRRARCAALRAWARRPPPPSGRASASTTRRAMSSCSWKRSPERRLHGVRGEQRAPRAPPRAARWPAPGRRRAAACPSPRGRRRPRRRAPSGPARRPRSGPRWRSSARPATRCRISEVAIASGRLKARKSVSGSGAQDAEGQHHEAGERAGQGRRVVAAHARARRAARSAMASADAGRSAGRLASARRITRSAAATAGDPVSAGGCS